MSTKSNQTVLWIPTSGQMSQNHAGSFRRKTENINLYTFWYYLQIFGEIRLKILPSRSRKRKNEHLAFNKKQLPANC